MRNLVTRLSGVRGLAPAVALAAAVALLVAGGLIALYAEQSYRAQKMSEVGVQAEILATTVTAALVFNDRDTAQEYVNALRANPELRAAAVYDARGTQIVGYSRLHDRPFPEPPPPPGRYFERDRLIVVVPVTERGVSVGTVYVRSIIEPVASRLARYGGIALLIVMASLMVAVLGAAQAALTRANRELAARAGELAEANRNLEIQIEERAKAEETLRQVQKLETIGQLTGGVAHDFNNLLTVILGNLDRLQRRLGDRPDAEELRRTARSAIRGAERAAALTQSLLAFSRRQPLNPKRVDVNRLVTSMSDLLRRTLGEQITIEAAVAPGLWPTQVDPNQLESALLNLAVNARDAMPSGGRLTISTANGEIGSAEAARVEVAAGEYVIITVADTGTGMTREVAERAFEPFFTTKDVGHGTGLGLSQVYGFVKQSGGHIAIDSESGRGTTVRIHLPRLSGDKDEPQPPEPSDQWEGFARSETVLVVEDNEGVREHSVAILTELGYRVIEASSGPAALAKLDGDPDITLLFTDVGLPGGMNGRALADEARRRRPGLKVLFTTGYARDAIVHDGRLDADVQLVAKPFTHAELAAVVRKVLDRGAEPPCILVVEDEPLVRINALDILGELGFRAEEAANATQAMNKVRASGGAIKAAIVDVGLPDRKGDALAADLRALYPNMPIVIASGYGDDAVRHRFAADPLVSLLGKPYDTARLLAALEALGVSPPAPDDEARP